MTANVARLSTPLTKRPTSKAHSEKVWLSPEQVCEKVPGLTAEILSDRRKRGLGPRYYKPSLKTVIYEESEIDAWISDTASTPRI